jgi:hypothetical protein
MKTTIKNLLALLNEAGVPVTNPRSGVRWYRQTGRWQVTIVLDGKKSHVGYYKSLYDAVQAREEAELKHYPTGRPPAVRKGRAVSQPEVSPVGSSVAVSGSIPDEDDEDYSFLDADDPF